MDLIGKAKRVRIYVSEGDKIGHQPAYVAILEWLRGENTQGATVIRGMMGFGAAGQIHTTSLVDIAQDLPVVIEWIDAPDVVDRLFGRLKAMLPRGLVTVDETEILMRQLHPVRDLPTGLTAGDVMSRGVTTVAKETPVREVVELMLGKLYRAVPVVEDGLPVGIITNGDLVQKGGLDVRLDLLDTLDKPVIHDVLQRLAGGNKVAGDVMTPRPATVDARTPLPRVAEVMAHRKLKRLPVVDERGALVGIVSRLDLLRTAAGTGVERPEAKAAEMGLAGDTPIEKVMRTDMPLVAEDTPLPEVFQAIIATRLNRALVVDASRHVVGLVTDAELLDRLTPSLRPGALRALMNRLPFAHARGESAAEHHGGARRASDLMTAGVPQVRVGTLLSEAIAIMLRGSHKVLAVTDEAGTLVGMVDRADLLHGLVRKA